LKKRFAEKVKDNLKIFGIEAKSLTDFTTTEKDMKRGTNRFPPGQYRLTSEDIIKVEAKNPATGGGIILGSSTSAVEADNTFEFQEEFQQNVEIRNKQFQENKNFEDKGEDDDDEEEEEEDENGVKEPTARQSMRAGGSIIFARNQADKGIVKLEDFIIMKMVGKGTFGKVYLVQHLHKKKIYAMKCIRKDIVIDNEQFENIKLEKDILYTIDHPFIVNMDYVFQNDFRIYFLMKFIKGGELFRHLNKVKRFTEDQARFMIV
jgi:serine/threonine protein kinase